MVSCSRTESSSSGHISLAGGGDSGSSSSLVAYYDHEKCTIQFTLSWASINLRPVSYMNGGLLSLAMQKDQVPTLLSIIFNNIILNNVGTEIPWDRG